LAYQIGDCLTIQLVTGQYIVVYIAGLDDSFYHLAYLDYYHPQPPGSDYFQSCFFYVVSFGDANQTHVAFEAVKIARYLLEASPDCKFAIHLDLGMLGTFGLLQMSSVRGITDVFERVLLNNQHNATDSFNFMKKGLMSIAEIKEKTIPVNPFPTVQLHKADGKSIHFWQIFASEPRTVVMGGGVVGHAGQYLQCGDEDPARLKKEYDNRIAEKRLEGYMEWVEYSNMVLQLDATDGWGSDDDLNFRNEIWDHLEQHLFLTGNGHVEGGDVGSGTLNLFFRTISPDLAVVAIQTIFEEKEANRTYRIAIENAPGGTRVIYPEGGPEDFSY
jgi:hypothetical protein